MPIDEKRIEPFLFDGRKLEVTGGSVIDTGEKNWGRCWIRVDGRQVVGLQVEKVDRLHDPMDESEEFRFRNRTRMADLPFPGLGALGDAVSMVSTTCAAPNADHLITYVHIDGESGGDVAERRKDLRALTLDIVPKVKKAMGCTK
ncbi:hypothetical protein LUX12_11705 [Streptomyces somaliensis]|uniref:hypothetical protein n=1 Tax=Streptomyces somaliensis TaxID=78355 RepID=UPI0020CB88CC|nr:hypothetical protein [Streptomyces somaliensis]MCP9945297.1 hypothetical protein [Streptomyces somaliensis]MCP9961496.1 hypothetical protein [Streptomyces somaliensis]MCP9974307.1 hypothetical protein [Streptomyces somaliensis]